MGAMWAGIGSAVAGLAGDIFSSSGQQATNAAQMQFAQQQQLQAESYDTQMSDTAMQRRVADLNAAGLNPLLAISQGGASTPTISPMGANLQNPQAAFANIGSQVSSAFQTQATIQNQEAQADAAEAQANLTKAQTPSPPAIQGYDSDGNPQLSSDYHSIGNANVAKIQADTAVSQAQARVAEATIQSIGASTNNTNIQASINALDLQTKKAVQQMLIQAENAENQAGAYQAANTSATAQGNYGRALAYINSILQPIATAAGAARGFGPGPAQPPQNTTFTTPNQWIQR